jgi:ubiquinone/menaquinone biosynthesis C-methylase UbiE
MYMGSAPTDRRGKFCWLLALALVACTREELDAQGRAMLDPAREARLRPVALVEHLGLRPDAVVADIGAGPGLLTLPLARAVPAGRVIATDINQSYLRVLERRAQVEGLRQVETRRVTPDTPGLADGSVDLVLLCQVDHVLRDRVRYLGQLMRALRPGGRIVIVHHTAHRRGAEALARAAGLVVVDSWAPSPDFFMLALEPAPKN